MTCEACPRIVTGWFRGCLVATATLVTLPVFSVVSSLTTRSLLENVGVLVLLVLLVLCLLPLTLMLTCILSGLPAAIVILCGEVFRIRSVLFYAIAGAAVGMLIAHVILGTKLWFNALLIIAGCLAGIAYWRRAGKYAGR